MPKKDSRLYHVRRVHIGKTAQLDELARACGELYSKTLVFFWRTVRHKGLWLKPKHLMRLFTHPKLRAHTSDACVQAFFAALKSWRERRTEDPDAKPPHKRKWYFRIEYKRSAMNLKDGTLRLSNGKGNEPLVLEWPWELPNTVVIHWTGTQYEAIATYEQERPSVKPQGEKVAGIDLGEIHMAVSHDGEHTHIQEGVRTVAIGDVRDIRQGNDVGHTNNQKIHQWSHGSVRFKLTYKAKQCGMFVDMQDEHSTSRTCPQCRYVRSKVKGRVFRCPKCHWTYHRDGVGSINIRQKYLASLPVVGAMAPPTGLRFTPHTRVARREEGYR